jgi:hypothetical protein
MKSIMLASYQAHYLLSKFFSLCFVYSPLDNSPVHFVCRQWKGKVKRSSFFSPLSAEINAIQKSAAAMVADSHKSPAFLSNNNNSNSNVDDDGTKTSGKQEIEHCFFDPIVSWLC